MLCDTNIRVSWRVRPRGFVALMSLYESNYVRFQQLAGDPTRLRGTLRSRVTGDCELQLSVLERMRYTSTLLLTYLLPPHGAGYAGRLPAVPDQAPMPQRVPDLRLRVYHDAKLLEAEGWSRCERGGHAASPAPGERELHQRWTRNMMLNKWLEYCAERGHRFIG